MGATAALTFWDGLFTGLLLQFTCRLGFFMPNGFFLPFLPTWLFAHASGAHLAPVVPRGAYWGTMVVSISVSEKTS